MKKQLSKLSLNKTTVANLEKLEMSHVLGGYYTEASCPPTASCGPKCTYTCPTLPNPECM